MLQNNCFKLKMRNKEGPQNIGYAIAILAVNKGMIGFKENTLLLLLQDL